MIDIERLKVDPAYWDESIDRSVIAVQVLGLNLHPCFFTKIGLDCFIEQGGDESQLIYRPQSSPASLPADSALIPDGATHYNIDQKCFLALFDKKNVMYFNPDDGGCWRKLTNGTSNKMFVDAVEIDLVSPASLLTDEQAEARIGEPIVIESVGIRQANIDGSLAFGDVVLRTASESPYPHYFKDVSGVDAIDLYHVAKLYEINDPALFHAFKKIACAGKRGAKDQAQDVQEAIDALKRWQELNK